jgi:hypothetical protein
LGFSDRLFGSVEYMIWFNEGLFLPALVTTQPGDGVLPAATILFGNTDIEDEYRTGARLNLGWWTDDDRYLALVAKIYGVEGGSTNFNSASNGNPVLARPFFNVDPLVNAQSALLIAHAAPPPPNLPAPITGSINIAAENDVGGAEFFLRSLMDQGRNYRLDLIAGYQYNRIDSGLITNSTTTQGPNNFNFFDSFAAENTYNAGTLGLYTEIYRDALTFSAMGKIGIGGMRQRVEINGTNTVTVGAGAPVTTAGGFLTQPLVGGGGNIGVFERDVLTWSPEVNLN